MKVLFGIFFCMFVYGVFTNHVGAGLLALFMSGFVVYGSRQLDKRDAEWEHDPRNTKSILNTLELLEQQGCEGSRSVF